MNARSKHRAVSLIEILTAVGLAGLLLVILTRVLIPGFQIWKQTQAISELEQLAMLAESRIEAAFLGTVAESITTVDEPNLQAVSFLDTEGDLHQMGYDPLEGKPYWRSMTVFFLRPATGELRQFRWVDDPLPTTDIFAFTQAELRDACDNSNPRRVAHKVTAFRVTPEPDELYWRVELDLQTNTPRGLRNVQRGFSLFPRIRGDV